MGRFARPRVAIVDDDPFVRLALANLLRVEGLDVVAALPAGEAAVPALAMLDPDLAIVGVDPTAVLLRRITAALPCRRVLVLAPSGRDADVPHAGAYGRLRRESTVDELVERVREALGVTADPP
jgi:DNA-binding NarL/FixJ family response regulator